MAYTIGGATAWQAILKKAFKGNQRIKGGKPRIIVKGNTGAPVVAAKVGTLCWNVYDGNAYICTVASGTWVKINA